MMSVTISIRTDTGKMVALSTIVKHDSESDEDFLARVRTVYTEIRNMEEQ